MPVKQIDHVGVLVDDIEEARAFLGETLGLELEREAAPPELGLRALFYRCGPVMIEAFEITDQSSALAPLAPGERARIEHIALDVDDVRASVAALSEHGVRPRAAGLGDAATTEPLAVAGNLNVWTEPSSSDGVVYQLIEKGAG